MRRAALGALRILIEAELDLDLPALVAAAVAAQPVDSREETAGEIMDFLLERLRGYYLDGGSTVLAQHDSFEAVLARRPASLVDFHHRLVAVLEFERLDAATALAAANKRIANILRQADQEAIGEVDPGILQHDAERALHRQVQKLAADIRPLLEARHYRDALERLATLREIIDRFFDDVLVMAPEARVRANRLALLAGVRRLFLEIADVSRLGAHPA
jgi:glycyl-tRNA synthetase beta chain